MRAWRVEEFGHYGERLRFQEDVPMPEVSERSALLRVLAAGVNFSDILAVAGKYQVRAEPPFTPGSEVCGEVVEAGDASGLAAGQRVVALTRAGGFAEYSAVNHEQAFPLPHDIDPAHAAAMLITYQTSHVALFHRGNLRAGEWVLVHGGAGGVGTAAIQLAKRAGANVVATAGGEEKLDVCRKCGADEVIDYRRQDFKAAVRTITDGRGVDVVYDPVGGDVFDESIRCLAPEGRLLVIGFSSGRIPHVAANRILLRNISLIGVEWPSYLTHHRELLSEVQDDIWAGYRHGSLWPVISRALPLTDLPDALAALESRESYGKIVVTVGDVDG